MWSHRKNKLILIILVTAILYLLGTPIQEHKFRNTNLPLGIPPAEWRPLNYWRNADLQKSLSEKVQTNKRWAALIRKKKMAVGVVDLSHPQESIRYASVNGETMMYAASLPKIAILLTTCQAFEDNSLKETSEISDDVKKMIRNSDNRAATRMIDRLGFDKIEATLRDSTLKLFDPERGGGLWVGKRYARSGPRHPDPIKGLSHAANVYQVCRFYYLLATGRLINPSRCNQMLHMLSNTHLHHKFVNTLDEIDPEASVYRKSGTWRTWHSDSVLVWGKHKKYILVGLVEDRHGEQILRDLVNVAENAMYL